MQVVCPNCGHKSSAKDVKPGQYKPTCPKCKQRFGLRIPADGSAPVSAKLVDAASATIAASGAEPAKPQVVVRPAISATAPTMGASVAARPSSADATTFQAADNHGATVDFSNPPQPSSVDATQDVPMTSSPGPDAGSNGAVKVPLGATAVGGTMQQPIQQKTMAGAPAKPGAGIGAGIPEVLGGYRLIKELGRGAMGAVYLAKQISLDRKVALKLIQAKWAENPTYVARFVREAYAAAQLTHHNVVQIYDLGQQGPINYYTMEFVEGQSLSDLVGQLGKLDPEQAVGYILQAARGLAFAHNQGMVHRDVKPANMMLNDHGVVKVADLGLVKTPQAVDEPPPEAAAAPGQSPRPTGGITGTSLAEATADVTNLNVAMGTPTYMAPEQSQNAAGVDHRADIYSLGCSLYVLLTGKPPFEGATAMEVITKHRMAPIIRPDVVVKRIPRELSEIVLKMCAKRPEDRYQNLDEVIKALEGFLGVQTSGPFSPSEVQAKTLEDCQKQFNEAKWPKMRDLVVRGTLALSFAGALLFLFVHRPLMAFSLALGAAFLATYFVAGGWRGQTYLFGKVRAHVAGLKISDWLTFVATVLLVALVSWLLGWLFWGVAGAVLGVAVGLGVHFALDAKADAERRATIEALEGMLKSMRLRGLDEAAIQSFVAKYSSDHWEELFEQLFGFEAKLAARQMLEKGGAAKPRPKFRVWREWIVKWIDDRLRAEREARDRKTLQKVEEENLKAQGMDALQARRRAMQVADAVMDNAAEQRAAVQLAATAPTGPAASATLDPKVIAAQKRAKQLATLAAARSGKYESKRGLSVTSLVTGPLGFALGAKLRFLAGCFLIAVVAMWLRSSGAGRELTNAATGQGDATSKVEASMSVLSALVDEPVTVPVLGLKVTALQVAIAGAVLTLLGLFRGWKMSFFAYPAAAVALLGGMFYVGAPTLFCGIAAAIAAVGLFLGRTSDD